MAVDIQAEMTKVMDEMKKNQLDTLTRTKDMKKDENNFDLAMQGLKIDANANKAFNDALKATANNMASMGRPQ